jgi:hypothetical protein
MKSHMPMLRATSTCARITILLIRSALSSRFSNIPGPLDIPWQSNASAFRHRSAAEAVWPWLARLLPAQVHFIMQQQLRNIRRRAESG